MTPEQIELHDALIRKSKELLAVTKAMVGLWEEYVRQHKPPPTVIQDPDPIKIHQQIGRR